MNAQKRAFMQPVTMKMADEDLIRKCVRGNWTGIRRTTFRSSMSLVVLHVPKRRIHTHVLSVDANRNFFRSCRMNAYHTLSGIHRIPFQEGCRYFQLERTGVCWCCTSQILSEPASCTYVLEQNASYMCSPPSSSSFDAFTRYANT